jgi:hypothetical protein
MRPGTARFGSCVRPQSPEHGAPTELRASSTGHIVRTAPPTLSVIARNGDGTRGTNKRHQDVHTRWRVYVEWLLTY